MSENPDSTPLLATLLTLRELQNLKRKYPTLEDAAEATGYAYLSLRARSIRLNVRWKHERRKDLPISPDHTS